MAASGNSIALKSFQSFQVNEGLLAKVVEAVKAGEKEARTSGDVKSFEVFYKGFRQNIAIGRIYIVPSKVCNDRKNFPVALLYGTIVRELNLGEETADLITNKIGDTEFDEYSQADFKAIKEKLFLSEDEKETSLVLYAPHWANIRDYIGFKYTSDDEKLANLLRHLVFAAYFNPAVSSAFDALMTNVDTFKFDVTDITPKLTYPFLSENPLKAFPNLNKAANSKKKVFLTAKTADAITQEVLDPEELNVFDALDTALTEATLPETTPMEEVGDFKGPSGFNQTTVEIPEVDAEATVTASDDGTEMRRRPDYGEKGSYTQKMNEENAKTAKFDYSATECPDCGQQLDGFKTCPAADASKGQQFCGKGKEIPNLHLWTGKGAGSKKADTADNPANEKGGEGAIEVKTDKEIAVTAGFDRNATKCPNCGKDLDAFKMCPDVSPADVRKGLQFCGKGGSPNAYLPPILKDGSASAPFETPFTNVGPGTSAHDNADHSLAVKVDVNSQAGKGDSKANSPIGIAIDETGVPRRPEEERKVAAAEKIAREIARDIDDGYVAMSSRAKAAAQKREDDLNKKYAGRRKRAEVPLTEESIWDDITMDFGEAPQVELPGEGSGSSDKSLPEAVTSDKPEETKGHAEEPAKAEEKALENPETKKEESSEPKKGDDRPKSRLFGKEGSSEKVALLYMNDYDIELAKQVLSGDPVLGPAVRFLEAFKEEVDSHSDGWAYWHAPVAAAAKLMTLIQDGVKARRESRKHTVTLQDISKAMSPIKAFMTRRGLAAGMQMPKLAVKKAAFKQADSAIPDVAEAKSEVVSPDTVDSDIKQPTESVEEAAKVAAVERTGDPNATEQYAGEHGCRTYENGKVCMKPEVVVHDGRKYCEKHRPAESKKKAADVSGDIAEAKSEVVNPDTVDSDIKQPTESVEDAAKQASDISGDIAEAKSEVVNPDTVDSDIHQPTESVEEAAKVASKLPNKKTAIDWNKYTRDEDGNVVDRRDFSSGITKYCAGCEEPLGDDGEGDTIYDQEGTFCENCQEAKKAQSAEFENMDGDLFENPALIQQAITKAESEEKYFLVELLEDALKTINGMPKASAAGDENDETVEMSLGMGDLADLAANLPHQDDHTIITASMGKVAEAYYTDRNFKTKKDLAAAVQLGRKIRVYDPGYGMGGEAPPPENGTVAVAGPHYPEPHRWYARVTLQDGIIIGVK
jgi:hypothetical protein